MDKQFNFWQNHSDTYLTMAYSWDRREAMERPDGYATKRGDCGDTVTIYLAIKKDRISRVQFELDGCLNTQACCNALASRAEGLRVGDAWKITPDDLIDFLQTLPKDHYHCAELTVGTFYQALAHWHENRAGSD